MKYIVVLGDGMADRPIPELGNKTPLQAAHTPNMDYLASHGTMGMMKTIPDGMSPASDTANLAVMGYDPRVCYSGRSPLEAVSMGISLADDDVTYRMNLVTLTDEENFEDRSMADYSAGEISTEDAAELVKALAKELNSDSVTVHPGISYRHCFVTHHGRTGALLTPPHDISGRPIREHLPKGENAEMLLEIMKKSAEILKNHPVNLARIARGEKPATSAWFWGEGTKPRLEAFEALHGVKGGVVCAVDLLKGIGICAGLEAPFVPGATGGMRTDFVSKGETALKLLRDGLDFVYIHIEAPDESGHHGDTQCKVDAIEAIDREVLGRIMTGLAEDGESYRVLTAPDHPTPIETRTHSADPVPFVLFDSTEQKDYPGRVFTEECASETGLYLPEAHVLMDCLITGKFPG